MNSPLQNSSIVVDSFGQTPDGREVRLFTLRNRNGCITQITDFGGIVVSLYVPDRWGSVSDVVLGFQNLENYLGDHPNFGTLVGRYANRIAGGHFRLDGKDYELAKNDGSSGHIHGGFSGFGKVLWSAKPQETVMGPSLELTYLSRDGEEGYPGNFTVRAVYTLTEKNELRLEFSATTDHATPVNLTQHLYFNLAGECAGPTLDHRLWIDADFFTPTDERMIPTGEIQKVEHSPFDFRTPKPIGEELKNPNPQLAFGNGYNHNWVLKKSGPDALDLAARVEEPCSGRIMEVFTTEPGLQFYGGNYLGPNLRGKCGQPYGQYSGFCLEPGHFPDSPNKPEFPSTILRPGKTYRSMTLFRFSAK